VIGACEGGGVAGIRSAQAVAAMTADIQEGVNLPDAVAHYRDRVFAHIGREEVARPWDLAFVAQKQPAAGEDSLQLLRVDLRLDKDAAADQAVLGIDQTAEINRHGTLLWCWPLFGPSSGVFAAQRLTKKREIA